MSNSILFFCLILRLHQELYFFHSVKFDIFKKVCNTLEGQTQVDPSTSLLIILPQFQLNLQTEFVILLTINQTVFTMLIQRI